MKILLDCNKLKDLITQNNEIKISIRKASSHNQVTQAMFLLFTHFSTHKKLHLVKKDPY